MKKLVTVIIPVYNVEAYLEKSVKSILNQTYENLEIILVDDGSTDQSGEMCDQLKEKDQRIKVIHKKNGGLSSARNAALDIMRGEYVAFLDSDDYVHYNMIEKFMDEVNKNNSDIVICNHFVEKDGRLVIEDPIIDQGEVLSVKDAMGMLVDDVYIRNYAWDKVYKASLFSGVRYPEGRNYEDIATTYLLFDQATIISRIPDYLYYYQMRESSISSNNTDLKWYVNCQAYIEGRMEMKRYFEEKKEYELAKMAFAKVVPYIYDEIACGCKLKKVKEIQKYKELLNHYSKEIAENEYVSEKDKKAFKKYTSGDFILGNYLKHKDEIKEVIRISKKIKNKILPKYYKKINFDLKDKKNQRIIFFELPCFDNLGDHAIAYAQGYFLKQIESEHENVQIYTVSGWDTVDAILQLKKAINPHDIIVCQGGGNFGNLYMFAEEFRRKIFKNFSNHRIIVFPQTMFYSNDQSGRKELKKSMRIINSCKNLTILARDHKSYELMKKYFNTEIVEMNDIVSHLDETRFSANERKGIVLCLRSDIESKLNSDQKKKLLNQCEMKDGDVLITDTVLQREVKDCNREEELIEKWKVFGKSKLVVTDRLHGMIFSLITKTPCIILGNNHHKVQETYKTFAKCDYLYYAGNIDEACQLIGNFKERVPKEKTSYDDRFILLNHMLEKELAK